MLERKMTAWTPSVDLSVELRTYSRPHFWQFSHFPWYNLTRWTARDGEEWMEYGWVWGFGEWREIIGRY